MLKWAAIFLIIAIISAIFGFGGMIAGVGVTIAKVLFGLFLIMFVFSLVTGRRM